MGASSVTSFGLCSVCGATIPASPAPSPYDGKVRLDPHPHPRPELGACVGSRMVTRPETAPARLVPAGVQMSLWDQEAA